MDIIYLNQSEFRKSLLAMRQSGGPKLAAVNKAQTIISNLQLGIDCSNLETNKGESRIKHAVKYDLASGGRLVTVQKDGYAYLLFLGTHDETEKWIDNHKGLEIAANRSTGRIQITHVSRIMYERPAVGAVNTTEDNRPYFQRIPDFDLSAVIVQPALRKSLLKLDENSSEEDIQEALDVIQIFYPNEAMVFLDMVLEVRAGRHEAASLRWQQHLGEAAAVTEDNKLQRMAVASHANADTLIVLNHLSTEEQQRLFEPDRFEDWMLFLHPDQKEIVEKESERPIVLNGVSGSGKTCILVHRARALARKHKDKIIGVITLNRSLAHLIKNLVHDLCVDGESERIKVYAFYDYFKLLLKHYGPDAYFEALSEFVEPGSPMARVIEKMDRKNFANEFDPNSGETLDHTWDDFTDQKHFKDWFEPVFKHLDDYRVDVWDYLREEFSLIRSACPMAIRVKEYCSSDFDRSGRGVAIPQKIREDVLRLLLFYQEYMFAGQLLDELELAQAVFPARAKIKTLPESLRFHALLIDEYQDLSTLDLLILRNIPTSTKDALFLAGDATQKVHVKSLRMKGAGLDILSADWVPIRKNYRNSRQILKAASTLAQHYAKDASKEGEDVKILDPELAVRETCKPITIDAQDQIGKAWQLISDCLDDVKALPWSVCIATAAPSAHSVAEIIRRAPSNLKAKALSGDHIREKDTVVVGTIQDVKGFEFSMVVIVGCTEGVFPPPRTHKDELWRHAFRLYVAMTRARDQVYLLYHAKPSRFLVVMKDEITWEDMQPQATKA